MSLYVIRNKKSKLFYGIIPSILKETHWEAHWYPQRVSAKAFCFDHDLKRTDVDILTRKEMEQEKSKRNKARR